MIWSQITEVFEEKSNEDLEDDYFMDLRLGLLIKGHVSNSNSNSDSNEQSEEHSEDDGEYFNSLGPIFWKYRSIK